MGSQGGGGTMSAGSAAKAREVIARYGSGNSPGETDRKRVENLGKTLLKDIFKTKERSK